MSDRPFGRVRWLSVQRSLRLSMHCKAFRQSVTRSISAECRDGVAGVENGGPGRDDQFGSTIDGYEEASLGPWELAD